MGDRCYVRVHFRESDEPTINKILGYGESPFEEREIDRPGVLLGIAFEANYGWCAELTELAKTGIPFIAFNDAGGEYGPGLTASIDGEVAEVDASPEGEIVVRFNRETGEPGPDSIAYAQTYLAIEKRVEEALDAAAPAEATG